MKNKCIKIVAFCALVALIFHVVFSILWIEKNSGSYSEFYGEQKNTANVVMVGTSNIRCDWIPLQAWKETGYNFYNMTSTGQPLCTVEYLIKESEKTQSPELYVIDLRGMTLGDNLAGKTGALRKVTDNMKFSLNRIQAVSAGLTYIGEEPGLANLDYYLSFLYYHSRWNDLTASNFIVNNLVKGYPTDYIQAKTKAMKPEKLVWNHEAEGKIGSKNQVAFQSLLDYIKSENLNVLFLIPPMQFTEKEQGRLAATVKWIEEEGYPIYDATEHYEEMGIDFNNDFRNKHHLNQWGAEKFTRTFSQYLLDNYTLEKHENAKQTKSWEEAYKTYEKYLNTIVKNAEKKKSADK